MKQVFLMLRNVGQQDP